MTPAEAVLCIEAYHWRQDQLGEMLAHFTGILMAPHQKNKKPIPARKLWNSRRQSGEKENGGEADAASLEERRSIFAELRKTPVLRRGNNS